MVCGEYVYAMPPAVFSDGLVNGRILRLLNGPATCVRALKVKLWVTPDAIPFIYILHVAPNPERIVAVQCVNEVPINLTFKQALEVVVMLQR